MIKSNISELALMAIRSENKPTRIEPPIYPKGVGPSNKLKLAMDDSLGYCYDYVNSYGLGFGFIGYPALAQLTQLPEYRMMTETPAKDLTRKFIKLNYAGDTKDKAGEKKLKIINQQLKKHRIRDIFRVAAEHDGYFGRGQIFINIEGANPSRPLTLDPKTIRKGSLRGFKNVEPQWVYPYAYNSTDPLAFDYFVPQTWYVMAKPVHTSRLLKIVSRPVPDILKPAYSFGGVSMSQLAQVYVNSWVRTRNSVSDIVRNFSINNLETNLESVLQGGDNSELLKRSELFNQYRDNKGLMLTQKDEEELKQLNTPLSGLSDLQAQSQEQLASVSHIPLVKLLGLSPHGLNASSDGEIRAYYDWIHSLGEDIYLDPLQTVIKVIQLDQFGEIDDNIVFEFEPLWQMDDEAQARIRKTNADSDIEYVNAGVVSHLEVRQKVANDPTSGYNGLDVEDLPELPDPANEPSPLDNEDTSDQ